MGAFMLAARACAPVLPVSLIGTRALLRGEAWRPHCSVLKVCIEKTDIFNREDWPDALQLCDSARRQILARLGEPDVAG